MVTKLTIEVMNKEALNLLKDLEMLHLIRMSPHSSTEIGIPRYKGAMSKEPLSSIDNYLTELREAWA
jgi:hypothetical protein